MSLSFSIDSILQHPYRPIPQGTGSPLTQNSPEDHDLMSGSPEELKPFSWLKANRYNPPKIMRHRQKTDNRPDSTGHQAAPKISPIDLRETSRTKSCGRSPRIPFTKFQVTSMETKFQQDRYLSSNDVTKISQRLHLTEARVKIWFQNRRARERRETKLTPEGASQTPQIPYSPACSPPEHSTPTTVRADQHLFSPPNPIHVSNGNVSVQHLLWHQTCPPTPLFSQSRLPIGVSILDGSSSGTVPEVGKNSLKVVFPEFENSVGDIQGYAAMAAARKYALNFPELHRFVYQATSHAPVTSTSDSLRNVGRNCPALN